MGSEPTIFLVACIVSLGLTALIREVAPRIGLTDNPDGHRKLHGRATPLGGGVAIYLTTAIILGTLWVMPSQLDSSDNGPAVSPSALQASEAGSAKVVADDSKPPKAGRMRMSTDIRSKLKEDCHILPGLLLAGLVIVIVGLIDDSKGLPGKLKLLGQMAAVSILLYSGLCVEHVGILGYEISLEWFAYPLTMLWMLGAINSLNLLDGIDGLATMLGIILSCTIAAMAAVNGHFGVVIIAMVFASSLLGFMRFNFPPATIFLGDTGSMLIGLMVGAIAIFASMKEPEAGAGTVLLAALMAVWTIPFFDVAAAIIRRKLTGRSIYATDRGHMHHRLLHMLGSNRKVLGWLALCCAVIATATLIGIVRQDDRIMLITCSAIVATFIITGAFGRVELLLVGARIKNIGRKLISPILPHKDGAWQVSIRLQGSQQWNLLWDAFVESADKLRLNSIRLDVNLPTVHESFHASWERPRRTKSDKCWIVEVPLVINGHAVGRVCIQGERNNHSACQDIQQLMDLIEPFEAKLQEVAAQDGNNTGSTEEQPTSPADHGEISAQIDQRPK